MLSVLFTCALFAQDTIRADFSSTPVCFGDQTQFINKSYVPNSLGTADYLWKFGDDSTSTEQFGKHKYQLADTLVSHVYNVTLIVTSRTNPPKIDSVTRQTTVFGLPDVYFTWKVTNDGQNQELSIDALRIDQADYFYQWTLGGVLKSNMRRPTFSGSNLDPYVDGNNHPFTLFMRSPDQCENLYSTTFNYNPMGINDVTQTTSLFSPNPAKSYLTFDSDFDNVRIVNLQGQIVFAGNTTNKVLNVNTLTPGIYQVYVEDDGKIYSQRLLLN